MSATTDATELHHKAAVRELIGYMADRAHIAPSSELTWFVEEWLKEYSRATATAVERLEQRALSLQRHSQYRAEERDAMVNLFTCASPFAAQSAELCEALLRWKNIVLMKAAEIG